MKHQRYIRAVVFATAILATALLALQATAGIAHSQEATVQIEKKVILARQGTVAKVTLNVSCPAGMDVLEAFVYISQDGNQSQFGPFHPTCDGSVHTLLVRVNAYQDAPFSKGKANASAYMLLLDPATQNTLSAQANREVKLKPKRAP